MNLTVSAVLDLDKLTEPYVLAIDEGEGVDGCFLIGSVIERCIQRKNSIALLLFHNLLTHYHSLGTKLGFNLMAYKQQGMVQETDCMVELFNDGELPNKENTDPWAEKILKQIYYKTKSFVDLQKGKGEKVTVILEYPSNLICAGVSPPTVLFFMQYIRSLVSKDVNLVCINKTFGKLCDINVLFKSIGHYSNLTVELRGLMSGSASDVTGSMLIRRKDVVADDNQQCHYHYQLLDKRIRIFAPGFVQLK